MTTMMISTTATTPTLTDVITVGDCQGGRCDSETDRAAAWLRRCFLVRGLPPGLEPGDGLFPGSLRSFVATD